MILLDANILLRIADSSSSHHAATKHAVFQWRQTEKLVLVPQSLYEFSAVATRALQHDGLNMNSERASRWISRYRQMFPLIPDPLAILDQWQLLILQFDIRGFQVHDARYVAAMRVHGITSLMTHNLQHFKRFPIHLIDPLTTN